METQAARDALQAAMRALDSGDDRTVLRAVQGAQDALDAVKADRLRALEDSRAHELDGASAVTTWARTHLRLEARQTRSLIDASRTLIALPEVAAAARAGSIRTEHVAIFTYGLRHIDPAVVHSSQDWLLDVARTCEPSELRRVMRALREALYPDSLDEAWAKGMDRQDISVNPVPEGWHVTGFLSTPLGAKLHAILSSLGAPKDAEDTRTGAERRTDALDELLSRVLAEGLPSDKGVRPQMNVTVEAETFVDAHTPQPSLRRPRPGTPATLAGFGPIGVLLLGYLSCVSDLTPILTDGRLPQADVLNVGRTRRLATLKQRRAINARQQGTCAAPGCQGTHLEIHHATWWSRGGRTDLDELIGLCPRCHQLVHRNLLIVTALGHGRFSFTDKDHRPLQRALRERVAAHRETQHIRRIAHEIHQHRQARATPMRV